MESRVMRRAVGLVVLGLSFVLSGCIYTHIITPLDVNLNNTPVFDRRAKKRDTKRVRLPYIDIRWDSNAIGDIMKEHGLTKVYYADLETLSVFGIWTQRFVIVYGE